MKIKKPELKTYHRFLDESGDCIFFGKKKRNIIGEPHVSKTFILGFVKFRKNLDIVRKEIIDLQNEIVLDPYYNEIPSVIKKIKKGGYFFHAKDDVPEIREKFFRYIKQLNCSFEAVVARKHPEHYKNKYESNESYFYADLLSHLIKNKLQKHEKLVLNIATRGRTTKNHNLNLALEKAKERFKKSNPEKAQKTKVVFNVLS